VPISWSVIGSSAVSRFSNVLLLAFQRPAENLELVAEEALQLLGGQPLVRGGEAARGQDPVPAGPVPVLAHRRIDGDLVRAEALVHLHHVLLGDVQPLGEQLGSGLVALLEQPLLLLAQLEEELPLGLGGPQLHHPPVVHDVAKDVRADPPGRVGRELHPALGIELLHRLHQADVPLLHQVEQRERIAVVLVGQLHHQAQVGRDQPRRGVQVTGAPVEPGEAILLLA
jgi:hypothetical protein